MVDRKLSKSTLQPSWQERLRDLLLAGGALGLVGCATDAGSGRSGEPQPGDARFVTCGNANPDPCICDRPKASPEAAKACTDKEACVARGGEWTLSTSGTSILCTGLDGAIAASDGSTENDR